jgi:sugar O-acyltransferase (sialic acid O-acetyltransferase NeuD family)
MIIVGAKGFAKELLEIAHQLNKTDKLVFFDNLSNDLPSMLFGQFPILHNKQEVLEYFRTVDNQFVLGLGNPLMRRKMCTQFETWGGEITSLISPYAQVGSFNTNIEAGTCIMSGSIITNDIKIREGVLINLNCTVGHDSSIGSYSELCPGVHISGNVIIGENCFIGTGAVILPNVELGNNVVVGAGSVVTKNVKDNLTVKGIPAK